MNIFFMPEHRGYFFDLIGNERSGESFMHAVYVTVLPVTSFSWAETPFER